LAEELAHRAAIAVDHARLYQEARRLQQVAERAAIRTSWLQSLTAALSESATLIQVADVIVQHSLSALGAAIACVALLTPDGTKLEIIRKIGEGLGSVPVCEQTAEIQVGQTFSIDAPLLLAEAVRTKQVQGGTSFASHCTSSPQKAETHREIYPAEAYKWIAVPLLIEARAVGGIGLAFATPQVLNQEDQSFIQALALQCAQAIERARLYEVEQQAREVAEAANRLKDEFLAMLSHELRSPLNPILGWVRLLQTRSFDAKTTQYALEAIERNAKLQAQLVEDLLDVSQILRGKLTLNFRLVNLNTTIRAALATVRSDAAAKSIQIHTSLDPTVPPILADASRLQQVVTNLLSNAIKFTPTEGWVEVRLRTAEGKGRWADSHSESSPSSLTAPPSFAEITISDTGQGITPEFLPHVFDSFRQADATTTRKFGGLGLGLAIVRQIVELHGGQVFADSAGEGQGATFTVWLPLRSNSIRT
jgi:signal transduction histidine kinase